MNSSYYKYCVVPQCKSTNRRTPTKLFIYVPNNEQIREKWLKLARRDDANSLSVDSRMYFCEDHFDLPNDMVNYMEYHIMGTVSQVRMKPHCVPSKFECQQVRRKQTCSSTEWSCILKKQIMLKSEENCSPSLSIIETSDASPNSQKVGNNVQEVICKQIADKSVQAFNFVTHKFRSKTVQTKAKSIDQALSPSVPNSFTSTLKTETMKSSPASSLSNFTRNILINKDHSDSDISFLANNSCSPSVHSLQIKSSSDCSEFIEENRKLEATETILNTIKKIEKKPCLYIGVPSSYYYLIDIIKDETNIPKHHLLLCLNKIRLDCKFNQLADDYGKTPSYLNEIFLQNIPLIARVMHPFIVPLDREMIERTLPMTFRHKYHNVSCIIDCLEIEVQKQSNAVNQALTWSECKKANTIKYLISCTPNGLVNYISKGFGGRTTDTCIVESCDFVKTLKSGMCVMVDKGFKHIEQYLQESGITLVRPPSVETGVKISKSDLKLTKQTPIERVIRRLHEFYMLKPHACIKSNFVNILDDIIIIACALINLQDSLIQ